MVVPRGILMDLLYSRHIFPYLIQWPYCAYLFCLIMPSWTTSILFTTENKVISVFRSNHIREEIPEKPEPTYNSSLRFCPQESLLVSKSVSVRVQPEKQNHQDTNIWIYCKELAYMIVGAI